MFAFVLAIFLSAFLLFQVQPIIARYILPWYGGSPAVWTTCMLFFQVGLLAGYTYAHVLVSLCRNKPRRQIGIHLVLLLLTCVLLPIIPGDHLKPDGMAVSPAMGIVLLLLQTVGLPYIAISATGPLLQNWFSEAYDGRSPYRLYAVSNAGSLLGLLSYPFLFEPNLGLGQQAWAWSGGYCVAAVLVGYCAWQFVKRSQPVTEMLNADVQQQHTSKPRLGDRLLWVAFAAGGSILLLAITNQMCQDVAVVPFLWVLPLSLYLLTFIISFDHARWYLRRLWVPVAALSTGALVYLLNQEYLDAELHLTWQIAIYAMALFSNCMICHGEMVRLKPHPKHLTSFYLAVSLGGALGGVFVSLVAPWVFRGYWELHAGLLFVAAQTSVVLFRGLSRTPHRRGVAAGLVLWIPLIVLMAYFLRAHIVASRVDVIATTRGFYGVLNVSESDAGTDDHLRTLSHGRICHGNQYLSDAYRDWAGTYFGINSGVGVLFNHHPERVFKRPMNIGVLGLGVGTIASWARPGDHIRFYEINAQVAKLAQRYFSYLKDCEGETSVLLGDGRVTLEHQLAAGENQEFDVLFIDAFSGDSIPIHLLTREAFELYFQHLKADGALMVHITNLHLDLSGPIRALAQSMGKQTLLIEHEPEGWSERYSRWVVVTSNEDLIHSMRLGGWGTAWSSDIRVQNLWTDDYCNLLQVLRWD